MQTSTAQIVNFILYADSQDSARTLASTVVGGSEDKSVWVNQTDGVELRGYIRWPKCTPTASPIGTTDCLVIQTTAGSENLSEITNYVDTRRGIPFKVVVSDDDMTSWGQPLGVEWVNTSDLGSVQQKLVNSAKSLETTLRGVFDAIDTNKNGLVSKSEIANLSTQLGHTINESEVQEIADTLAGEDGNITYGNFKRWWIQGRSNFVEFRKLVEMELSVGNFLRQGSSQFNSYFETLQKEIHDVTSNEVSYRARVFLGPQEEFTNGVGISVHINCGADYKVVQTTLPDYIVHSPITYSFEIGLKDPESGPMIVSRLNELKEMFSEMIPQLKNALNMGVEVHFRHVGNSVFIDTSLSGVIGQQVQHQFGQVNIGGLFSGNSNFHITSGWQPLNLLNNSLEENVRNASHLKIEGGAEFSQFKALLSGLSNIISNTSQHLPPKIRTALLFVKCFSALRKYEFELKYGASDLFDLIREGINANSRKEGDEGWQKLVNSFAERQLMFQGVIEQGKSMAMFLTEYMDILKSINFDSISIGFTMSVMQVHYKFTIHLPNLTSFLTENFLN